MTARILPASLLLAATLASSLAACAGTPREPRSTYQQELDRLVAECHERGGILVPVPRATTGRPQTENVCEIRGGASRLN